MPLIKNIIPRLDGFIPDAWRLDPTVIPKDAVPSPRDPVTPSDARSDKVDRTAIPNPVPLELEAPEARLGRLDLSWALDKERTEADAKERPAIPTVELAPIAPYPALPQLEDSPSFDFGHTFWHGTDAQDVFHGSGYKDIAHAYDGDDTLYLNGGDDIAYGGAGRDVIYGGTGNDTIHGGAGNNLLFGQAGDDLLIGGDSSDVLRAGAGTDTLVGNNGDDVFVPGEGADTMYGGFGADTVSYADANEGVFVALKTAQSFGGAAEGDVLHDIENIRGSQHADILWGDGMDNVIFGNDGADEIRGQYGDDILYGGANGVGPQGDVLNGGSGSDTFVFRVGESGGGPSIDLIEDFEHHVDTIRVEMDEAYFLGNFDGFHGQGSQIVYQHTWREGIGDYTLLQMRDDVGFTPDFQIGFVGHISISHDDIEFF